jgi:hypothetical protein
MLVMGEAVGLERATSAKERGEVVCFALRQQMKVKYIMGADVHIPILERIALHLPGLSKTVTHETGAKWSHVTGETLNK